MYLFIWIVCMLYLYVWIVCFVCMYLCFVCMYGLSMFCMYGLSMFCMYGLSMFCLYDWFYIGILFCMCLCISLVCLLQSNVLSLFLISNPVFFNLEKICFWFIKVCSQYLTFGNALTWVETSVPG